MGPIRMHLNLGKQKSIHMQQDFSLRFLHTFSVARETITVLVQNIFKEPESFSKESLLLFCVALYVFG
jgi:hypothetical protein